MDTEKQLLEIAKEILGNLGYRVLTATDCESALELYRKEDKQIDLVILELIMPGIGGKRCLEELVKIHPEVRVVVNSGISESDLMRRIIEVGAKDYITKPYYFGQMVNVIRRVLDQDRG